MNLLQAVNAALHHEMERDENVIVLGEDVGQKGGVFGATDGLWSRFGENRVLNTPLSETGIVGAAIGMALYGLKPVPEIQFLDFIYPAFDQIVSEAAKMRYRTAGEFTVPMVIRSPYGGGIKGGHYHSQSAEAYFCHTAGLKVVVPSTAADTKGLLISSIRDPDPVIFLEPKRLYRSAKDDVPEGETTVPLGKACVRRAGSDLTLIAWGAMVPVCLEAAEQCAEHDASCEVIDVRTLVPLDVETILKSVRKTGRVVIVHEAPKTGGFGAEIAATIAERALDSLEAPIARVAGFDIPFPYTLESAYMPDAFRVARAVARTLQF